MFSCKKNFIDSGFIKYLHVTQYACLMIFKFILVHISWVSSEEHHIKVETVWYSQVNLVGQNSTKSVYSAISSLLQPTEKRSKSNVNLTK